jgi:predicted methyltransferase
MTNLVHSGVVALFLALAACGGDAATAQPATSPPSRPSTAVASEMTPHAPLTPEAIRALIAAPDRTDADRKTDVQRHAPELLAFIGVGPGMAVADLGAGGGYTTELLVRAVGPSGKVYGQNDPELLKKFMESRWAARLSLPINKGVVRSDRPFDAPLAPEATNLDLVVDYIFYHDTVWIGVDRAKMNAAVFSALKPGGAYVIVDASAKDGHGVADVKTLHRIEQSVVESEVKAAGFTLASTAEFLRNPADARDWSSSPGAAGDRLGTEDRFVLKFVKP